MATITARYLDGTTEVLYSVQAVGKAMEVGATLLRDDGTPYVIEDFNTGQLLDGCVINRILYGVYLPGQKEVLDAAGKVCALDFPAAPPPPPPPPPAPGVPGTLVPVPWSEPFILVPTGEPVTTVVLTVAATIIGAIFGIFSRKVPDEVAKELGKLRDGMISLGQELIHIGQILAAAIARVIDALKTVYEKVIKPALARIEEVMSKIGKVLDKVLKPYLEFMQRIRQIILDVYKTIFLPIITAIQTMRKALAILKILHVPGVAKLDAKLQRIQGKLIGVITDLLRRTNDHAGFLNVLLTLRMTLQHGVFLTTLHEVRSSWVNSWWNEQTTDLSASEESNIAGLKAIALITPGQKDMDQLLTTGSLFTARAPGPGEQELDALLNGSSQL